MTYSWKKIKLIFLIVLLRLLVLDKKMLNLFELNETLNLSFKEMFINL
jgi:hypothetical protein